MKTVTINIQDEYADVISVTCMGHSIANSFTSVFAMNVEDGMVITQKSVGEYGADGYENYRFVKE